MTPTEKMIGFLRTLTYDGFLSSDEVWLLAKFLNENEECRHAWPGNMLFPMLHMAFEDGELTEGEMNLLAQTIAAIEQQWLQQRISQPPPIIDESTDTLSELTRPQLPCVDFSVEIPSSSGEGSYTVNLLNHGCSCPDWFNRKDWPIGHLGRVCKHVAYAFAASDADIEPWVAAVLDDVQFRGKGTHVCDDWFFVKFPKRKPVLISGGSGDWCNVYISSSTGYERYGFNRQENRWSYGEAPRGAKQIQKVIRENL